MNDDRQRRQLEFFGCILASVTHQLNNVLSTTDQVAGLLGDMLAGATAGRPLDAGKVGSIKDRLLVQVQRGAALVEHLNAFAHSADRPRGEIDLGRLVHQFLPLYERFAARRRLDLAEGDLAADVHFQGNPLACQHALFLLLETVAPATSAGGRATVAVRATETGGFVEIHAAPGEAACDEGALAALPGRLAEVEAPARLTRGGGGGPLLVLEFGEGDARS
jgi:C4-dicarboxylate-specific signal transduction histidine kinase